MSGAGPSRELLPRPLRLLMGATGLGVGDRRLREAVDGKVVLVTGASSGVGEATARRLGAAGAEVLLVARTVERLEQVRAEIVAVGGRAFVHPADMADPESVEALAAAVLEQHGHVDVVVSNAGLSIRRWVSQSYDRFHDFERTINVNYLGPVRLLLALLPAMRERGSGHIVNVATVGVNMPPIAWSAYIASKEAFETWLKGVAPEIRADGVTTTSIHLQLVRSPMLGPFRMWRYLPGMSPEEAAGMVARAIVTRPRTVAPPWARIAGPVNALAQAPIERGLAAYAGFANPASRPGAPVAPLAAAAARSARVADDAIGGLLALRSSRVIRPVRPDRLARAAAAQLRFGLTPAAAAAAAAALHGDRPAVIDERRRLSFAELDARARALAAAMHQHLDLRGDRRVAIMARNHAEFAEAAVAITRLGCDLVLLSTDSAAPQLADVLARERVDAVVHDEEFGALLDAAGFEGPRALAWHEGEPSLPTLETLIGLDAAPAPSPRSPGRVVVMTSGTTGTPKGVARDVGARGALVAALPGLLSLGRLRPTPRAGEPVLVAPPLFHMYGLLGLMLGLGLGSPVLLARRFDAERALAAIDRHEAGMALLVPTMLKRIVDLPEQVRGRYDTSSLRVVTTGAAPLPPELALASMDLLGDVLFNAYASTEVGAAAIATPRDLRAAPGTVGRPPYGVTVKILDEEGLELPRGETGRIFVGSALLFEGYTGGGARDVIDGLMRTGDVGHFDERGRLFVDGRDDDMILSGGENVYPQEVEELLLGHAAVADAAVTGVPDEDFGQRLAAFVVLKPGGAATAEELKRYVGDHLARHKVPRDVEFLDELPRTATGKLRRGRLAERPGSPGL